MPRPPRRTRCSRAQSTFSAFFHGHSVITTSNAHPRKDDPTAPVRTPIYDRYHTDAARSRSPTSTRSLIDPSSSPLSYAESLPSEALPGFERGAGRSEMAHIPPSRLPAEDQHPGRAGDLSRHRRARRKSKKAEKETRRLCFPGVRNPKIRRKVVGCLISGSLLVTVLTICMFPSPPFFSFQLTNPGRSRPRNLLPPLHHLHPTLPHHPYPPDSPPHNFVLPLPHPAVHARLPLEEIPHPQYQDPQSYGRRRLCAAEDTDPHYPGARRRNRFSQLLGNRGRRGGEADDPATGLWALEV